MIVEGKNLEGKTELSSMGFIPFRRLDYMFDIRILDYATGKVELDEIKEGDLVKLSITPIRMNGDLFDSAVSINNLSLHSGYVLFSAQVDTLKIEQIRGNQVKDCYFARVPSGGYDRVSIGGTCMHNVFFGSSKSIRVLPGDINRKVLKKPVSSAEIKIKFLGRNLLLTNSTQIGPGEQLTLELFNILGCRVARYVVGSGSPKQFNLDKLSSGLYFCVVNFRGSVVKTNLISSNNDIAPGKNGRSFSLGTEKTCKLQDASCHYSDPITEKPEQLPFIVCDLSVIQAGSSHTEKFSSLTGKKLHYSKLSDCSQRI
jgi:hypothetical protein